MVVETTANLSLIAGSEDEHEHGAADEHEHGEYDPHTWISPALAKQQAQKIYDAFVQVDPSHSGYYAQRWASLSAKFESMDQEYSLNLSAKTKSIIFVTHGAFGYLADRYGFEQVSVIGISADEINDYSWRYRIYIARTYVVLSPRYPRTRTCIFYCDSNH